MVGGGRQDDPRAGCGARAAPPTHACSPAGRAAWLAAPLQPHTCVPRPSASRMGGLAEACGQQRSTARTEHAAQHGHCGAQDASEQRRLHLAAQRRAELEGTRRAWMRGARAAASWRGRGCWAQLCAAGGAAAGPTGRGGSRPQPPPLTHRVLQADGDRYAGIDGAPHLRPQLATGQGGSGSAAPGPPVRTPGTAARPRPLDPPRHTASSPAPSPPPPPPHHKVVGLLEGVLQRALAVREALQVGQTRSGGSRGQAGRSVCCWRHLGAGQLEWVPSGSCCPSAAPTHLPLDGDDDDDGTCHCNPVLEAVLDQAVAEGCAARGGRQSGTAGAVVRNSTAHSSAHAVAAFRTPRGTPERPIGSEGCGAHLPATRARWSAAPAPP